jgi:hypothetical protein
MADKTDETGKGPQGPGEGPRRPFATIDLQATELGGKARPSPAPGQQDTKSAALPPPDAPAGSKLADHLSAARRWGRSAIQNNTFLSHVAAGIAGAILTLSVAAVFGLLPGGGSGGRGLPADAARRLAALEQATRQTAAVPHEMSGKLAKTDARIASLEERTSALSALSEAQAKLATQTKALESRVGAPELAGRMAKLETALAALAAADKSGRGPQADALAAKLAELEKLAAEAGAAAKSISQQVDRDLASLNTEAARLGRRVDTLKGEIETRFKDTAKAADLAPVLAKIAAFEKDLQGFLGGELERSANASRVLLALEIANLKRAMDRGEGFASELEAVKKAAGGLLQLSALEPHKLEGVRTLPELAKDFRRVANAAIDAEAEQADASVLDRLVAGAKGIVRVRKAGHDPKDMSVEAIAGRMETALTDGRLAEVLAQGKTLPPKAALAAEDWLKKVAARHAVDQAMAEIEAGLKSSLRARPAPERRQ